LLLASHKNGPEGNCTPVQKVKKVASTSLVLIRDSDQDKNQHEINLILSSINLRLANLRNIGKPQPDRLTPHSHPQARQKVMLPTFYA